MRLRREGGRLRSDLRTGALSPRITGVVQTGGPSPDGAGPGGVKGSQAPARPQVEVVLVATGALLIGGDQVDLQIDVGSGVDLRLREVAATVAQHGRGRGSRWQVRVRVAEGARCTWWGEPLIVSDGAQVVREQALDVASGGVLVLRESLVLGRSRQRGGSLRNRSAATVAGDPALVEELDLTPAGRELPGVLGPARVLDSVLALGAPGDLPAPPVSPRPGAHDHVLTLEHGGWVWRGLLEDTHGSRSAAVFARAAEHVLAPPAVR